MFGDPFSNPGSMPNTLPGMSPRLSTTWTSRQRQAKGFNKNQILEVEGCRQRQIGLNIEKLSGAGPDFSTQKDYNIISPRARPPTDQGALSLSATGMQISSFIPSAPKSTGRSIVSPRVTIQETHKRPGTASAVYGRSKKGALSPSHQAKPLSGTTDLESGTIGMSTRYAAAAGWRPMSAATARQSRARKAGGYGRSTSHETSKGLAELISGHAPPRAHVPSHVATEKQVLRYYCYFTELNPWKNQGTGLPDCARDQLRICSINYYITDGTLAIYLNEKTNSGITGGVFFKKSRAFKPDGSLITAKDILVGQGVTIVGRNFTITDADKYTRQYMKREFDIVLAKPHPYPNYEEHKTFGAEHATGMGKPKLLHKKATGGAGRTSAVFNLMKTQMKKEAQFYEHDRHVLRFHGMWDDRASPCGMLNPLEVHYYLADDTLEITEKLKDPLRRGYEAFPTFLKKCKCAKNWEGVKMGQAPDYVTPDDLVCGSYLHVFGRPIRLLSCDLFTRQYYKQQYDLDQPTLEAKSVEPAKIEMPVPKLGDGFLPIGSEDDTIGTVWGHKRPFKDMDKLMKHQNKMMRARMKLAEPKGNDINKDRRFILTYYLEDDTVAVYEEALKNSGIGLEGKGGTYLKRGKYVNALTQKEFEASDLFTDGLICVQGYDPLRVLEMDLHSVMHMEHNPHTFPFSNMDIIMRKILDRLRIYHCDLRKLFKVHDPRAGGVLSYDLIIKILMDANLAQALNTQEVLTLCRFFSDPDEWGLPSITQPIRYRDFCDMATSIAVMEMTESDEKSKFAVFKRNCENAILNDDTVRNCLSDADQRKVRETLSEVNAYMNAPQTRSIKEWNVARQKYQKTLEPLISAAFYLAYGIKFSAENESFSGPPSASQRLYRRLALSRVMWRANFRDIDPESTGYINADDLRATFEGNNVHLSNQDLSILMSNFATGDGAIPYHALCDAVFDTTSIFGD